MQGLWTEKGKTTQIQKRGSKVIEKKGFLGSFQLRVLPGPNPFHFHDICALPSFLGLF